MSRSKKKTPGFYITRAANSPGARKKERRNYNRKWRRIVKHKISSDPEQHLPEKHDEIINMWEMIQDGFYIKDLGSADYKLKGK